MEHIVLVHQIVQLVLQVMYHNKFNLEKLKSIYNKIEKYNTFEKYDKPSISIVSCSELLFKSIEKLLKHESINELNQ